MPEELSSRIYIHFYGTMLASLGLMIGLGIGTFGPFFKEIIESYTKVASWSILHSTHDALALSFAVGGLLAALSGGFLYALCGRHYSLIVMLMFEGWGLFAMRYKGLYSLYAARAILGYAACFWMMLVPLMLKELFPQPYTRRFEALLPFFVSLGTCVGYLVSSSRTPQVWEGVLTALLIFQFLKLLAFGCVFNMESPVYMLNHCPCRDKHAENFEKMYSPEKALEVADAFVLNYVKKGKFADWKELFSASNFLPLLAGIILTSLTQLTGAAYFNFYARKFLQIQGLKSTSLLTMMYGLSGLAASTLVIFTLNIFNKKSFIISGLIIQIFAYLAIVLSIAREIPHLAFAGLCMHGFGYAQSLGGIQYSYCVSTLPALGLPFCLIFQWLLACVFAEFNPLFIEKFGYLKMIYAFGACTIVGTLGFFLCSLKSPKKPSVTGFPFTN